MEGFSKSINIKNLAEPYPHEDEMPKEHQLLDLNQSQHLAHQVAVLLLYRLEQAPNRS